MNATTRTAPTVSSGSDTGPAPVLPEELTIYTVAEWAPQCRAWMTGLEAGGVLRVDAAPVAEVDSAGVQLLVALANAAARREGRLELAVPSAPLAEAITRVGAAFLLGQADVAEARA